MDVVVDRLAVGTRCSMPRLAHPIVDRPRLVALLADGVRHPVTLVSGPPGAGKTTLLASWLLSVRGRCAAWLTVDAHDDQAERLAALVVEALVRSGAPVAPAPGSSGLDLLDAVFEQLLESGQRCVLVLEDVQELRSPAALRLLAYLVERGPAGLDIVLSARADPPIGWGRLWLDGRLGEIRHADLAFTEADTAALVAAFGVALSPEDVRTLWQRTDGWAAGLRLAVGALQSEEDPHQFVVDAAATEAAVSDYMLGEVLMRQDQATQDFLLRTSVVEQITPELAIQLSGQESAGEVLLNLVHRGLFVVELEERQCYQYHDLFRALLQARLRQRDPDLAAALHRQAAEWHLAHALPRLAASHARAAGDWPLLGRMLIEQWLEESIAEGAYADDQLVDVPPEAVLETPELALIATTDACRWARREEADLYRAVLVQSALPTGTSATPEATWAAAQLLADVCYGWAFGGDARSAAAVATLRTFPRTELATPRLRQLGALADAEQAIDAGELDRAERRLRDLADRGESAWYRTLAAAMLAVIDATAGRVRAADARLSEVLEQLQERMVYPTVHFAHLAMALSAAQHGAQRAAAEALSAAEPPLEWSSHSLRYVDRAARAAAAGRPPFFVSLDGETARHPLAERALIALGVLEVVDAAGRSIAVGGEGERVVRHAREELAEAGFEGVVRSVAGWLDSATRRHPRTVIEAGALIAIAAHRRGDRATARRRLCDALDVSTATGITAPLLVHGDHLRPVLEANIDEFGARTATVFELLDRLLSSGSGDLVEPLTDREVEVLQLLPTLMSNAEIAEGMHLSVNTVKTHLKAVYRKLGVEGRREAVLRGRELELL